MVHLATVEAEIPATPGRSLQCCSQHTESERSGWADRADMKRDWCMTSVVSAGKQRQGLAGRCQGPDWPPKPAHTLATRVDHGPLLTAVQSQVDGPDGTRGYTLRTAVWNDPAPTL